MENTSDSHPDYKVVHNAREAIAKVTQEINEIKRRKDLGRLIIIHRQACLMCLIGVCMCAVVKYTGSKEDRKGSLSVHSIQKKMRRIQQTLTQFTGLRSKVCTAPDCSQS